jgi:hypothetical protein
MLKPYAMLLTVLVASPPLFASDVTSGVLPTPVSRWSESQVAAWAAAHSPAANLLQSERAATSASIDREDRQQCAQAALLQNVTRELECYERERSAARALTVFLQLRGLIEQKELLDAAYRSSDKLLRLAEKADELNLADGNRFELDKQRLQIADQQAEAGGGIAKLQVALSELIDKPFTEVIAMQFELPSDAPEHDDDFEQSLSVALSQRCDLKAIQTLCRSINNDTLPIVRQVMSSLRPGIGLAVAVATRKSLLGALHHDDPSTAELCQRREQCAQLRAERESQIEAQIRLAIIERDTAKARLEIAKQRLAIDEQLVKQSVTAIELDQAKPGADILAGLERLRSQGEMVEQQTAVAIARVKLREATGTVLEER